MSVHVDARHAGSALERICRREPQTQAGGDDERGRVSLFSTLTTVGMPRDITLEEFCVELFYPADGASAALLRCAA